MYIHCKICIFITTDEKYQHEYFIKCRQQRKDTFDVFRHQRPGEQYYVECHSDIWMEKITSYLEENEKAKGNLLSQRDRVIKDCTVV